MTETQAAHQPTTTWQQAGQKLLADITDVVTTGIGLKRALEAAAAAGAAMADGCEPHHTQWGDLGFYVQKYEAALTDKDGRLFDHVLADFGVGGDDLHTHLSHALGDDTHAYSAITDVQERLGSYRARLDGFVTAIDNLETGFERVLTPEHVSAHNGEPPGFRTFAESIDAMYGHLMAFRDAVHAYAAGGDAHLAAAHEVDWPADILAEFDQAATGPQDGSHWHDANGAGDGGYDLGAGLAAALRALDLAMAQRLFDEYLGTSGARQAELARDPAIADIGDWVRQWDDTLRANWGTCTASASTEEQTKHLWEMLRATGEFRETVNALRGNERAAVQHLAPWLEQHLLDADRGLLPFENEVRRVLGLDPLPQIALPDMPVTTPAAPAGEATPVTTGPRPSLGDKGKEPVTWTDVDDSTVTFVPDGTSTETDDGDSEDDVEDTGDVPFDALSPALPATDGGEYEFLGSKLGTSELNTVQADWVGKFGEQLKGDHKDKVLHLRLVPLSPPDADHNSFDWVIAVRGTHDEHETTQDVPFDAVLLHGGEVSARSVLRTIRAGGTRYHGEIVLDRNPNLADGQTLVDLLQFKFDKVFRKQKVVVFDPDRFAKESARIASGARPAAGAHETGAHETGAHEAEAHPNDVVEGSSTGVTAAGSGSGSGSAAGRRTGTSTGTGASTGTGTPASTGSHGGSRTGPATTTGTDAAVWPHRTLGALGANATEYERFTTWLCSADGNAVAGRKDLSIDWPSAEKLRADIQLLDSTPAGSDEREKRAKHIHEKYRDVLGVAATVWTVDAGQGYRTTRFATVQAYVADALSIMFVAYRDMQDAALRAAPPATA